MKKSIILFVLMLVTIWAYSQNPKSRETIEVVGAKNDTIEAGREYIILIKHRLKAESQLAVSGGGSSIVNKGNGKYLLKIRYGGKVGISVAIRGKAIGLKWLISKGDDYIDSLGTNVSAEIHILVNDRKPDLNDFEIDVINLATNYHKRLKSGNLLTVPLLLNNQYKIVVGHEGFNYRTIEIDTHAPAKPWILECSFHLYTGEPNSFAGKLQYSEGANQFVKIE
jgi:hypothetical protein